MWKVEFSYSEPMFGDIVIEDGPDTEPEAYEEAERLIRTTYPEAQDIVIMSIIEIE